MTTATHFTELGRRSRYLGVVVCLGLSLASPVRMGQAAEDPAQDPVTATVLGEEVRTGDPEELRYRVLGALTERYAAERGITVSDEDIDAYLTGMAQLAEQDRRERAARRAAIEQRLDSPGLPEAEGEALRAELEALASLEQSLTDLSGGDPDEDRRARRTVAEAFVRQWKIDRALYREYGGRIGFQQGGPEPLDAYRRFLEEQQAQGAFEIRDKDLETAFWRYFLTDSIHSFYPSEEGARAFDEPWWTSQATSERQPPESTETRSEP
jgi:hypothetical protein